MPRADESPCKSRESRCNGTQPITSSQSARPSRLVFDDPQRVAAWCAMRMPNFSGWGVNPTAIGYECNGELAGGVVYTHYSQANILTSIVLEAPLTRRFLFSVLHYPFVQLGMRRITALVEASNTQSLRLCEHLGFVREGIMRDGAVDGDVIVLGMLRSECRWL